MKILMVAIPNHHFFQWVNQLKDSGHEVFWFDVTDGGPKSDKIEWVTQIKGWKLTWDFPLRSTIKKQMPKLYRFLQSYNEQKVSSEFQKAFQNINPDIVHVFEMQLAGLPTLPIMKQNNTPLIYSSWGSDMFNFEGLGLTKYDANQFLKRVNYLITDCKRDCNIALENGFKGEFLGVFPGNGGLQINTEHIKSVDDRNSIMIKGYEDGVGKASIVLKALELVESSNLINKKIVIYSADSAIETQIKNSSILSKLPILVYSRYSFISNETLLELMGESCIHIANSISDGMPNALLEAMAMGAFPIQSNPGHVTEEVIKDGENGFMIKNPLDETEIVQLITKALENKALRKAAQYYNVEFIQQHYNRIILKPKITSLYQLALTKSN